MSDVWARGAVGEGMSDHSPEPWVEGCREQRYVACVNTLAGIPDEVLPALNAVLHGPLKSHIIRLILSAVTNEPKEKPMCKCDPAADLAKEVKELVGATAVEGRRPTVQAAIGRLEDLLAKLDDLATQLNARFSSVLCTTPQQDPCTEPDLGPGSEMGQVLMKMAKRLDDSCQSIQATVDAADL